MELLTKNKLLTAVLAVLSVAGIGAYIFQLAGGLAVTGMSNGVSWGLYITMFMFFVGLSAGGLIVASSASVFHIKRFKAVATIRPPAESPTRNMNIVMYRPHDTPLDMPVTAKPPASWKM